MTNDTQANPFGPLVVHYVNHLSYVVAGDQVMDLRRVADQQEWIAYLYTVDPKNADAHILERANIFYQAAENYAFPPLGNVGTSLETLLADHKEQLAKNPASFLGPGPTEQTPPPTREEAAAGELVSGLLNSIFNGWKK